MFKKKDDVARMMQAQGIAVYYMKYLGNARVADVKGEDVVIMALIQACPTTLIYQHRLIPLARVDPAHQRGAQEGGLEGAAC